MNASQAAAILSAEELYAITGYVKPAYQLRQLHERGFWRAWRCKTTGEVILERPHYDAVSRGIGGLAANDAHQPQLRKPGKR